MGQVAAKQVTSILVVEDDEETLHGVSDALREQGYDVFLASNGHDALKQLRAGLRPSVILLDLMMPPLNGWQFHAEQMKDPELARIPVIVMTAAASYWGLPDGVTAYLQKPFDLETLFSEIERVAAE